MGLDIARMMIPRGALDREVPFTFTPSTTAIEVGIDMDTDSLAFGRPVEMTMSFAHCPPGLPNPGRPLAIWRYRQRDSWQNLGGTIDPQARTITVSITELSRFAIGTH